MIHEGKKTGGFAGPRGVEDKIFLLFDEKEDMVQVESGKGRDAVMDIRPGGACCIEEFHETAVLIVTGRCFFLFVEQFSEDDSDFNCLIDINRYPESGTNIKIHPAISRNSCDFL